MNESTPLLEQMADRADDFGLASPAEIRRAGERRRHRQVTGTVTLAAAVIALVIVVTASRQPHQPPPVNPPPKPHAGVGLTFDAAHGDTLRGLDANGKVTDIADQGFAEACAADHHRSCYVAGVSWSPDGQRAVVLVKNESGTQGSVWLLQGGRLTRLFACPGSPEGSCDTEMDSPLSWSPDGHRIGVASGGRLYVADVDGSDPQPQPLPGCGHCFGEALKWSPDGRWMSFLGADGVYRLPSSGGPAQRVASIPQPRTYAWSPDSTKIVSDARNGLYIIDLSSTVPTSRHVVRQRPAEGPGAPIWSPGGHRIAWFSTPRTKKGFVAQLWTADARGQKPVILHDFGCCIADWDAPVWSPDGGEIGFALDLRPDDPRVYVLDSHSGAVIRSMIGWGPLAWR